MPETTMKEAGDEIWRQIRTDVALLIRQVESLKVDLRQSEEGAKKEMKETLLDLLEVLDAFERVFLAIAPKEEAADRQTRVWLQNFRNVRKQLARHMEKRGVTPITAPEGR